METKISEADLVTEMAALGNRHASAIDEIFERVFNEFNEAIDHAKNAKVNSVFIAASRGAYYEAMNIGLKKSGVSLQTRSVTEPSNTNED